MNLHLHLGLHLYMHLGLYPKLVKVIELTSTNSKVNFRNELSESFEIKSGLRQGVSCRYCCSTLCKNSLCDNGTN